MIKKIKKIIEKIIMGLANISHIDLLGLAYKKIGILREAGDITAGEKNFIRKQLKKIIGDNQPIFFDGGANVGEFSLLLRENYPKARIFAFEPNNTPYEKLQINSKDKNIEIFMAGLSSSNKEAEIFTNPDNTSKYGSIYKSVLTEIHHQKNVQGKKIELVTLDGFCQKNNIDNIDFLKLDIEGHEVEALRGGENLLKAGKIKVIQFEFNAVNIISRIFLKDFYDLMPNHNFYRIRTNDLLPLGPYNAINEIFRVHNLVAILKESDILAKK